MKTFVALLFLAFFSRGYCQILKPGFDKAEYIETLKLITRHILLLKNGAK